MAVLPGPRLANSRRADPVQKSSNTGFCECRVVCAYLLSQVIDLWLSVEKYTISRIAVLLYDYYTHSLSVHIGIILISG
jgi:hypothetical protein